MPETGAIASFPSYVLISRRSRSSCRLLPIKGLYRILACDCCRNLRRNRLRTHFTNLIKDESGVTAIEYALIAALVAVAAIAAMTTLGTSISGTFDYVASCL